MDNYHWLILKLDAFIRKYYANKLLRGVLVFIICLLAYMLTASLSEYYFYLPSWLRLILFTCFIVLGLSALLVWVIIPLTKMAKLGKTITHEQAANIIGQHFPEVSDRLLNILQLKNNNDASVSRAFVEASINQKAAQIAVIPIANAIDFSKNKKYLPYLIPLVLLAVIIMLFSPSIFIEASQRLLQPTKTFERPAPFQFVLKTNKLQVVRNDDFILTVTTTGQALPAEMQLQIGNDLLQMQAVSKNVFQYTFKNVTDDIHFKLSAAGFYSTSYVLHVVQKPIFKALKVQINYPSYIGKQNEMRTSLGDMKLPIGTELKWAFVAEYTDDAFIRFGSSNAQKLPHKSNVYGYAALFYRDTNYTVIFKNNASATANEYNYNVQVIPDQYPVLQVEEYRDSVNGTQILLNGTAGDDYGISKLLFHYNIINDKNETIVAKSIPLKITGTTITNFQHYFDVDVLQLQPGQKLNYFIEAWDNDGVHGSKASRSEMMTYAMYNISQIDSAMNANAKQINAGFSNTAQQTKQMQSTLKDMQAKMLQSDKLDWEQQQSLQQLAEKQEKLQKQLEANKKRFEEQIQQSKQKNYSEDVREKQEELQKQMDNLLNKELKEQMKKLQELMAKLNKDNAVQTMKQMEQENKLFNMDLERMKELMKKLELQMRMEDLANKMDKLSKDQLALKKQTDEKTKDNKELSKEQQDLKKQLDEAMKEDMKEMKDLNSQMQQKQDMGDAENKADDARKDMQQSEQQLGQQQNNKASQSQKQAAQNLQEMANSLRSAAGGMEMQQLDMDIRAVRQILTNLIRLSFDQEQLMDKLKVTATSSPSYLSNQQEQNHLHKNSKMIKDSLFVLSKRIFKLAASVNKETTELENNMQLALNAIEARGIAEAAMRQQFVMTRTNNLALLLNEMLSNLLQQQAQSQSQQKGSCNNPGGKTPKPGAGQQLGDMITKQKQLGDAMQQMKDAQQKRQGGSNKGGQQKGEQSGDGEHSEQDGGEYGNAEQLARMAQQQSAIRRQLQELQSLLNSKKMGNPKVLNELQKEMDKTETDLVNRRLSNEMLLRQKEILNRLLETEKAVREQEQDDKRSAKTPQDLMRPIPAELQKYLKERATLKEMYQTVPPQLKPYYKVMVDNYFKMIGNSTAN